jgi:hypothetical protein
VNPGASNKKAFCYAPAGVTWAVNGFSRLSPPLSPEAGQTWRRAAANGWVYDQDVEAILGQGLPATFRALLAVLDSIDSRLGELEKRADLHLPPLADGVPDPEADRYFAWYTLRPGETP